MPIKVRGKRKLTALQRVACSEESVVCVQEKPKIENHINKHLIMTDFPIKGQLITAIHNEDPFVWQLQPKDIDSDYSESRENFVGLCISYLCYITNYPKT